MSWFDDRLSHRHRIAVSTLSQTGGNLAVALIGVGIIRITTNQLGPANYGLFALIITYVSLFTLITDLGITAMTNRELGRQGADQSVILSTAMSSRVGLSIAVIPLIVGSSLLIYRGHAAIFTVAMAVMASDVVWRSIQTVSGTAFTVRLKGHTVSGMLLVNRGLYLLGVIAVALAHGTYVDYVASYVAADLVVAMVLLVLVHRVVPLRWTFDLPSWWQAIRIAVPLGIMQVIANIYAWVDSVMVSILRSSTELAYYSLAFNAVNVLSVLPGFLMVALMPTIVNAEPHEVERLVGRAMYVLVCVGGVLGVGAIVLSRPIVLLMASASFTPARVPLIVLACTIPLGFAQTVISYACVTLNQYRPLIMVAFMVLLLNVVMNCVMIPTWGPTGAAITLLCTELISLLGTWRVFSRLTGLRVAFDELWRPGLAMVGALGAGIVALVLLRGARPIWTFVIDGSLISAIYVACLSLARGVPEELPLPRVIRRWVHPSSSPRSE